MACGCGCGFSGGGFAAAAVMSSMMSHPYYGTSSTYHSYRDDEQTLRPKSVSFHCAKCGQPTILVGKLDDHGLCSDCTGSKPTATHTGMGKIVHPNDTVAPVAPAPVSAPTPVASISKPTAPANPTQKKWWQFWKM